MSTRSRFFIFLGLLFLGWACGGPKADERRQRQKAVRDSIRRVDSLERVRRAGEAMKKAKEDSLLELKEYQEKLARYDSLRAEDSLKIKRKKRPAVKPAPRRELGGKSPVK